MMDLDVAAGVELMAEGLSSHPGVDEDEGGAGGIEALLDGPRLGGEVLSGELDVDREAACDRDLDERERAIPAEKPTDIVRVPDGRREADPLEFPCAGNQALERHRKLGSPFAVGKLVNLVDDDIPDILQVLAEALAYEQCLQGLRGRDEEIRRVQCLLSPLVLRRIPVPDPDRESEFPAPPLHPIEDVPI